MRLCIRHLIARVIILLPVGALVLHSATSMPTRSPSATDSPQGTYDGPAELPRVYMKSAVADTPASGRVWNVSAGDNLQNILNSAECGDTVLLKAGSTFTGTFILPAKDCDDSHWIIVRTSAP